jgi:hypothetical protein
MTKRPGAAPPTIRRPQALLVPSTKAICIVGKSWRQVKTALGIRSDENIA